MKNRIGEQHTGLFAPGGELQPRYFHPRDVAADAPESAWFATSSDERCSEVVASHPTTALNNIGPRRIPRLSSSPSRSSAHILPEILFDSPSLHARSPFCCCNDHWFGTASSGVEAWRWWRRQLIVFDYDRGCCLCFSTRVSKFPTNPGRFRLNSSTSSVRDGSILWFPQIGRKCADT